MVRGARIVCGTLITVLALAVLVADARATDRPMVEAVVDHDSGAVLWSSANPTAVATLKPGQEILIKGRDLGPGPITAARPGLGPPAGGVPPGDGTSSVTSSPPAAADKELSKVLFGNVRAFERNLSSYPARIDLQTGAAALFAQIQEKVLDYFVEKYQPVPDTWAGDIYAWGDTEIDLTVPITAYEGPIQIVRIPLTGSSVLDILTGAPLRYRDPNTARVVDKDKYAFVDGWQIARTGESVLASNTVPVSIAQGGADRLQYGAPLIAGTSESEARATQKALERAATGQLRKTRPTMRSAADQYAYGQKAYWAWDWNLALPHLLLGVDWDGIFGFRFDQKVPFLEMLVQAWKYKEAKISRPVIEPKGYQFPEFNGDGTVKEMRLHKAMIDRINGDGVRPYTSFGAVPLMPEAGAERLIAPPVAFNTQKFDGPTPYPIAMALHLPFLEPLPGGQTNPTGWVGYTYAEARNPIPGQGGSGQWIGFSCAACHAARVTYEYEPDGKRISRIFSGIPNPDWKATFLTLSGRAFGVSLEEELPLNFIRYDQPAGTQKRIESRWGARGLRFLDALGLINEERNAKDIQKLSKEQVDKTLLIYNMPPGTVEATLFVPSNDLGDYANDYLFSPHVIPIITNHTPVRRALSRSELIDGFEGAYLHGEEPEGARADVVSLASGSDTLRVDIASGGRAVTADRYVSLARLQGAVQPAHRCRWPRRQRRDLHLSRLPARKPDPAGEFPAAPGTEQRARYCARRRHSAERCRPRSRRPLRQRVSKSRRPPRTWGATVQGELCAVSFARQCGTVDERRYAPNFRRWGQRTHGPLLLADRLAAQNPVDPDGHLGKFILGRTARAVERRPHRRQRARQHGRAGIAGAPRSLSGTAHRGRQRRSGAGFRSLQAALHDPAGH